MKIHISGGLDSILIFINHFLSVLKISKTFVFFLRMSGKYSKKYRQGSVFTTDPWKWILKTDPCPYLVIYSLHVLKIKTKVLDIFNTNKKCFMKINKESSPPEIWIRIRFHNGSGSPSLMIILIDKKKTKIAYEDSKYIFVSDLVWRMQLMIKNSCFLCRKFFNFINLI